MTLTIQLSADTEKWLATRAAAAGTTPEGFVSGLIAREKSGGKTFAEIFAPVRDEVAASGMTEDEVAEFLEQELADMRREKREAGR
jgi:hypothetical protein